MAKIDDEFDSSGPPLAARAPSPTSRRALRKGPRLRPQRPGRKTPSALTTPIGGSFPPGCAGKASIPCPRSRKPSASISPPVWRAVLAGANIGAGGREPVSGAL